MNMQNKLCPTQFFSLPNSELYSQSLSSDHKTHEFSRAQEFRRFHRTCKSRRTRQTHGKRLNSEKSSNSWKKRDSCALAESHLYTEHHVYGIFLRLAAWLCSLPDPAHPLFSQTRETEKSPWFLSSN